MPKTKTESVVFTLLSAWPMVYIMTLYNQVLAAGSFTNASFLTALRGMWAEYVLICLCAFFISSPLALRLAFRVVRPDDRPIAVTLTIQVFMVVLQVALASVMAVCLSGGPDAQLVPRYLTACCRNFVMALPVQLLLAGPLARWLFRLVFRRGGSTVRASA